MITISIKDAITPLIQRYLENNPRMIRSLSKSIGWFVQKNIKTLSQSSAITSKWRRRTPLDIRRKLDAKAPKNWLGQLRRAIGYSYNNQRNAVEVGWTSSTAAMEGRVQEFGANRNVTPRLREFFASRGVRLGERKKTIRVPARPLFEPSMEVIQPNISDFVSYRVGNYMKNGGFTKNVGKGRKYEVFG